MASDLRERIQQKKKEIIASELEFFHSSRFKKLLLTTANEIIQTGEMKEIKLFEDPVNGICGFCKPEEIYLNIANRILRSFPTLELKVASLIGVLGHECGHKNCSDFNVREAYLQGIKQGNLLPELPYPTDDKEKEALKRLKVYLQEKNETALTVIGEAAGYIHNILADIDCNQTMCTRYPGSIRRGIEMNNQRILEIAPTIKEQIASGYQKLSILLNMITTFAFSGRINNWDSYAGEEVQVFRGVVPLLEQCMEGGDEWFRLQITNQILLKAWSIIEETIQDIDGKQNESQEKEGNNGNSSQISEKSLEREVNQIKKEWIEIPESQPGGTSDIESEKPSEVKMQGKKESAEEIVGSKQIELDEKLHDIIYEMAKIKAQQEIQKEKREGHQIELEECPFTPGHQEVQKKWVQKDKIELEAKNKYESLKPFLNLQRRKLKALLLPVLQRRKGRVDHKLFIGNRVDLCNASDIHGRVFQKKYYPSDNPETVIAILIDQSFSMEGNRLAAAMLTALAVYEFCREAGIPVAVYGHHTDGYRHDNLKEETVFLHCYAEFEPECEDKYRILQMEAAGANRDGTALLYMGHKLLKRRERQKILLLISDGLPNATMYNDCGAVNDLKQIKVDLTRKKIQFMAAAIGEDKKKIEEIYREAFLDISVLERMPHILANKILKSVSGRY